MNSHNIKIHIIFTSAMIIGKMESDITNQLISLKIDCAKGHSRSIMHVYVQNVFKILNYVCIRYPW